MDLHGAVVVINWNIYIGTITKHLAFCLVIAVSDLDEHQSENILVNLQHRRHGTTGNGTSNEFRHTDDTEQNRAYDDSAPGTPNTFKSTISNQTGKMSDKHEPQPQNKREAKLLDKQVSTESNSSGHGEFISLLVQLANFLCEIKGTGMVRVTVVSSNSFPGKLFQILPPSGAIFL